MKRNLLFAALFGLVLAIPPAAQAADAPAKNEPPKKPDAAKPAGDVISVVIHPAAEPKPALKYHLLPTFLESTPGDAVPLYAKALVMHMERWKGMQYDALYDKKKPSDFPDFEKWFETPLDTLPRDRARKIADAFGGSVKTQLDMAVRREHCYWDTPLRQGHVFETLLPETQEFRNMARILALRARLQIAEGKYEEAVATLKTGYGMARHIAEQPFLVSNLVGLAIANMMNDQLLTLCQQPGAPNLYWSIAELPSPWIDKRQSIGAEYDGLYLQWPELQAVRHAQYAPEQWNRLLRKIASELIYFDYETATAKLSDKERATKIEKMIAAALAGVPKAKAELLAAGYTQKEVDAMCPAQIVMLYSLDTYDRIRDDVFKWWNLSYAQASDGLERAHRDVSASTKREILPLAYSLLPGGSAAKLAFARTDRQFAAIRCIEALRLYAATHNGELPATLDEIKEVPIPLNPMTGKPFPYHLEGKKAVLDADGGLTNTPRPQYRVVVAQ